MRLKIKERGPKKQFRNSRWKKSSISPTAGFLSGFLSMSPTFSVEV
ncbi:MAG: hypothetical protein ACK521_06825 [bacterium]